VVKRLNIEKLKELKKFISRKEIRSLKVRSTQCANVLQGYPTIKQAYNNVYHVLDILDRILEGQDPTEDQDEEMDKRKRVIDDMIDQCSEEDDLK